MYQFVIILLSLVTLAFSQPIWQNNIEYNEGDIVIYQGDKSNPYYEDEVWIAQRFVYQNTPPVQSDLGWFWLSETQIKNGNLDNWRDNRKYNIGDTVIYNDALWEAKRSVTLNTPPVSKSEDWFWSYISTTTGNLLKNGSFEEGKEHWSAGEVVNITSFDGSHALELNDNSTSNNIKAISDRILIDQTGNYILEFYAKADVNAGETQDINLVINHYFEEPRDQVIGDGSTINNDWMWGKNKLKVFAVSNQWEKYQFIIRNNFPEETHEISIEFQPVHWKPNTLTGKAWFDKVTFNEELRGNWLVRDGGFSIWEAPTDHKVQPGMTPPPGAPTLSSVTIDGARDEYEPFQLVFTSTDANEKITGITLTDLQGPGGTISKDSIALNEVAYVNVTSPTDTNSYHGWVPDPLPPINLPLTEETAIALVHPAEGRALQPIWFTVHIPTFISAGTYTGTITVTLENAGTQTIEVNLRVWDFSLPPVPTFKTSFGVYLNDLAKTHKLDGKADDARTVMKQYLRSMSEHRIAPIDPFGVDTFSMTFTDNSTGRVLTPWRNISVESDPVQGNILAAVDDLDDKYVQTEAGALVPVTPGETYRFTGKYKTEGEHDFAIYYFQYTADEVYKSGRNKTIISGESDGKEWHPIDKLISDLDADTRFIRFAFNGRKWHDDDETTSDKNESKEPVGTTFYDDIVFQNRHWDNYTTTTDVTQGTVLEVNDDREDALIQRTTELFPIDNSQSYSFSCKTRTDGTHDYEVYLCQFDASGNYIRGNKTIFRGNGTGGGIWDDISATLTGFDAQAQFIKLFFNARPWFTDDATTPENETLEPLGRTLFDDIRFAPTATGTGLAEFIENFEPETKLFAENFEGVSSINDVEVSSDFSNFEGMLEFVVDSMNFNAFNIRFPVFAKSFAKGVDVTEIPGISWESDDYGVLLKKQWDEISRYMDTQYDDWLTKAYSYWIDEPNPLTYTKLLKGLQHQINAYGDALINDRALPGMAVYNHNPDPSESKKDVPGIEMYDLITHLGPQIDHYTRDREFVTDKQYDKMWWYICTVPKAPYANVFIDHAGVEHQILSWMAYKYDSKGLFYWTVNYNKTASGNNPWDDPSSVSGNNEMWGNGDGRLLYPPKACYDDAITTPITDTPPITSIRWDLLREGLEDYEYLHKLETMAAKLPGGHPLRIEANELLTIDEELVRDLEEYSQKADPLKSRRISIALCIEKMNNVLDNNAASITIDKGNLQTDYSISDWNDDMTSVKISGESVGDIFGSEENASYVNFRREDNFQISAKLSTISGMNSGGILIRTSDETGAPLVHLRLKKNDEGSTLAVDIREVMNGEIYQTGEIISDVTGDIYLRVRRRGNRIYCYASTNEDRYEELYIVDFIAAGNEILAGLTAADGSGYVEYKDVKIHKYTNMAPIINFLNK